MATKTIGSGGDYATLAAWASYVNALSLSADEIGEVTGIVTDSATVTVGGFTANGFKVILRAAAGEAISAGGRAWFLSSGRATLSNSVNYAGAYSFVGPVVVENLQLRATASNAANVCTISNAAVVQRCVLTYAGVGRAVTSSGTEGADNIIRSSLIIVTNNAPAVRNGTALSAYRCTTIGSTSGVGFRSEYSGLRAIGCVTYNSSSDFVGNAASGSGYNATDKGSFGGTGWGTSGQVNVASGDFVATGVGSEDYRAASGSAKLKDTGTTISGVSIDLFGTAIPQGATPDIGATEVAAGGGSPPAGTVTISDVNPGETSAVVTYSYSAGDATGYQYRIDGGTPATIGASPATITGLTASTEYDLEVRAVNGDGDGAWSIVSTFTTDAATGSGVVSKILQLMAA